MRAGKKFGIAIASDPERNTQVATKQYLSY